MFGDRRGGARGRYRLKPGTPLIETDKVSSESAAFRMMPNGAGPAATVRDEGAVKVGVSASLS